MEKGYKINRGKNFNSINNALSTWQNNIVKIFWHTSFLNIPEKSDRFSMHFIL